MMQNSLAVALLPQRGQALLEALLALGGLLLLLVGMAWIGGWQQVALGAGQHSRGLVFGMAHGQAVVPRASGKMAVVFAGQVLGAEPAPLVTDGRAAVLAGDWLQVSDSVWSVLVRARHVSALNDALSRMGLPGASGTLAVQRHTSLLAGAGHAGGDQQTQQKITRSHSAWRIAADKSAALARREQSRMEPVDAVWQRGRLSTDWLQPWSGQVPDTRIDHSAQVLR